MSEASDRNFVLIEFDGIGFLVHQDEVAHVGSMADWALDENSGKLLITPTVQDNQVVLTERPRRFFVTLKSAAGGVALACDEVSIHSSHSVALAPLPEPMRGTSLPGGAFARLRENIVLHSTAEQMLECVAGPALEHV